jgi:diguanylate cyclase (GGDEF)-like protein
MPWLPRVFAIAPERLGDSALVVPVRRAGDLIGLAAGVPSVENAENIVDVGQESIVGLLEALADQVALATEFAHSARDAQQNAHRFALLAAIAEIALAKLGATEMVDAILARVREHFDAHKASLFLLHGDRGSLGTRSVQRQDQAASRMYTSRVAVTWEDQLIGSLVLRRTEVPFDQSDEETLVQVAEQIALALSASGRFEFEAAMAVLDMLTELPNRRSAEATLDNELGHIARGSDAYLVVCLLDIDYFKTINDTYGHETGDQVLRQIATMFKAQLRGSDYVARWGGEEFLLLYRTGDLTRSRQVAERVRRAVGMINPKAASGNKIEVSMSLGGAICPLNGSTRDALLAAADAALYQAKRSGRDLSAWAPVAEPVSNHETANLTQ